VVLWLILFLHILKVLSLNLYPETGYLAGNVKVLLLKKLMKFLAIWNKVIKIVIVMN